MNNDILKILSQSNKDIDNQKLMDYISNKISDAERNEIESAAAGSDLYTDAIEGLEQLKDGKKIDQITNEINLNLGKKLLAKRRRPKRTLISNSLIYYAVIIILLLAVITFIIIKKHLAN